MVIAPPPITIMEVIMRVDCVSLDDFSYGILVFISWFVFQCISIDVLPTEVLWNHSDVVRTELWTSTESNTRKTV